MLRTLTVSVALFLATACSSSGGSAAPDGGGGGGGSPAAMACYGQCAAQAKATGCGAGGLTQSECQALCDAVIPNLGASCLPKAQAAWACGSTQTWQCSMGSNLPLPVGTACNAQAQAYAACSLGATDAGAD